MIRVISAALKARQIAQCKASVGQALTTAEVLARFWSLEDR